MKTINTPETRPTTELAAPFPTNTYETLDPALSSFFDSKFDEFIAVATGPEFVTQSLPLYCRYMKSIWQAETFTLDEIMDAKYEEISLYAGFQFQQAHRKALLGDLADSAEAWAPLIPKEELDIIVADFITIGAANAQERRLQDSIPTHPMATLTESEHVIKSKFEQMMRPVVDAAKAVGAIAVEKFFTGPTNTHAADTTATSAVDTADNAASIDSAEPETAPTRTEEDPVRRYPVPYEEPGPFVPGYDRESTLTY